jgi:hypothetical protein
LPQIEELGLQTKMKQMVSHSEMVAHSPPIDAS